MSLIAELKRRNVFRVGVAYAIVAWLLIESHSDDLSRPDSFPIGLGDPGDSSRWC